MAGVRLAELYLEFLAGRCRPNTVRAAASDLKVFFTMVGKPPEQVRAADVLAFITAQRTGRSGDHGVLRRWIWEMSRALCRLHGAPAPVDRVRVLRVFAGPRRRGGCDYRGELPKQATRGWLNPDAS